MPIVGSSGAMSSRAWRTSVSMDAGQQQWTTVGSFSFVVPDGIREICGVTIAPGSAEDLGENHGNYGGGLSWKNAVPVTPGETLTIDVGSGSGPAGQGSSSIRRGGTTLISSVANGGGAPGVNAGGGNGGGGGAGSGGGGAGGYVGNGGNGAAGPSGDPPALNSGGGVGGGLSNDGGGVGLEGRTADFAPGSRGVTKCGGGRGEGTEAGAGGVRIMWGIGRSYPDNAVDV